MKPCKVAPLDIAAFSSVEASVSRVEGASQSEPALDSLSSSNSSSRSLVFGDELAAADSPGPGRSSKQISRFASGRVRKPPLALTQDKHDIQGPRQATVRNGRAGCRV